MSVKVFCELQCGTQMLVVTIPVFNLLGMWLFWQIIMKKYRKKRGRKKYTAFSLKMRHFYRFHVYSLLCLGRYPLTQIIVIICYIKFFCS